ncbi:glycosyltransferase [Thermoproteota archaeon]
MGGKPKRILMVISSLKLGGGVERITTVLGTHLNRRHNEVHYLTFYDIRPRFPFEGKYYTLRGKLKKNHFFKRFWNLMYRAKKISDYCKKHRIDCVISHKEEANFSTVISRLLFRNKSRIFLTLQTNPLEEHGKLYKTLISMLFPLGDKTITVSKKIAIILNESFGVNNTHPIYNMIDIKNNILMSKEHLPKNYSQRLKKGFNFVTIGRLVEPKGQWYLLRSMKKVIEKYPHTNLIIIGDGKLKKKHEALVNSLSIQDNVIFTGNQKNVLNFLKKSDCFVLTSLWEGLAIVLIEALNMNLPIISTDCETGPREVLTPELNNRKHNKYPYFGRYGILIEPFDRKFVFSDLEETPLTSREEQLSKLMMDMVKDKKLRSQYSQGLKRAKDFDTTTILKEWEDLIHES